MNFHSESYEWLVVNGAKARYKGLGAVNGSGNYGFMVTVIDGSADMFRIKIWDIDNNDAVVYDNQPGLADDADPASAVEKGSIVVHTN